MPTSIEFLSLRLWWVLFPRKIGTVDSWKRVYIQVLVPVIFVFLSGSAGIVQSCLAKWVSKQVTYAAKVVELVLHERGGKKERKLPVTIFSVCLNCWSDCSCKVLTCLVRWMCGLFSASILVSQYYVLLIWKVCSCLLYTSDAADER